MRKFSNSFPVRRAALLAAAFLFLGARPSAGQNRSLTLAQAPGQARAAAPTATLTIDDAVRIALQNQPRIRQAIERVRAQEAVVGQDKAAYYPSLRFQQSYGADATGFGATARNEAAARLSLDYILYNFGRREGTVQSDFEILQAQRHNSSATTNDVIFQVKQSFYLYLAAEALVKVREEAVRSRELLVNQARGFFEVGTRAKIDVARAEANLFSARADLIAAQNGVQIALATLKNAMGVDQLPGQPVAPPDVPTALPTLTLDEARGAAFVTRAELKSLEAQRRAQDQRIAVARRGHLPEFSFGADVGREAPPTTGSLRWNGFWEIGLSMTLPIFDGLRTTYQVQEELRNYYLIRAQEDERRQQIALEVETAYLRVVESEGRIKANEAALAAARENFELANGRYQVGVGTIIEVTDAQTTYTDAQTRYIQSVYDYKIAEAELARAIGER
ncbi:MAG TPA: TolC family protein [Candidatus Acidoferrales bacterium]|nr:TolC family protein [Candidatus Acidoferrales bacterium]